MALLNRFSKLNDRGETGIFTFIVTKSVTRDLHRDATTKDFCFGYHRWAISFQRPTDKMLGVHLLLRNASPSTACVVDFTLALLNREHFSQNQVYSKRQAKFTITNPMQGVSRWIELNELAERRFSNETGEFLFELSLSNMTTIFECDIQLGAGVLNQYKQMLKFGPQPQSGAAPQQGPASGTSSSGGGNNKTNNKTAVGRHRNQLINLETNNFTFGSFEWSLTIVPLVVSSGSAGGSGLLAHQNSSSASSSQDSFSLDQQQQQQQSQAGGKKQHAKSAAARGPAPPQAEPGGLEPVCRVYLNRLSGFDSLCRVKYRVILGHHQPGGAQSAEFVDSKQLDQISDCRGRIRGHQFRQTNVLKLISPRHQQAAANQSNQTVPSSSAPAAGKPSKQAAAGSGANLDLRVHIEMFCANTISEARVPLARNPNEPQASNCSDRNKQAWCVESDCEGGELLRLKLFFMDLQSVPRNHIRYISWIAHLVRRDPKSGQTRDSLAVRNSPHSNYYLQDGIDLGAMMETDIQVEELHKSPKSYLENGMLTVHIEWIDSLLLFSHLYNNYDALATVQRHQISRELSALQQEFDYLEGKYLQAQRTLNRLSNGAAVTSAANNDGQPAAANNRAAQRSPGQQMAAARGQRDAQAANSVGGATKHDRPKEERMLILDEPRVANREQAEQEQRNATSPENGRDFGPADGLCEPASSSSSSSVAGRPRDGRSLTGRPFTEAFHELETEIRLIGAMAHDEPRQARSLPSATAVATPNQQQQQQLQQQQQQQHRLDLGSETSLRFDCCGGFESGPEAALRPLPVKHQQEQHNDLERMLDQRAGAATASAADNGRCTSSLSLGDHHHQACQQQQLQNNYGHHFSGRLSGGDLSTRAYNSSLASDGDGAHFSGMPFAGHEIGAAPTATATATAATNNQQQPARSSVRRRLPQPNVTNLSQQRDRPASALFAGPEPGWMHGQCGPRHRGSSVSFDAGSPHHGYHQQQQRRLNRNELIPARTRQSPAGRHSDQSSTSGAIRILGDDDDGISLLDDDVILVDGSSGPPVAALLAGPIGADESLQAALARYQQPRHSADSTAGRLSGAGSPYQHAALNAVIRKQSAAGASLAQHRLSVCDERTVAKPAGQFYHLIESNDDGADYSGELQRDRVESGLARANAGFITDDRSTSNEPSDLRDRLGSAGSFVDREMHGPFVNPFGLQERLHNANMLGDYRDNNAFVALPLDCLPMSQQQQQQQQQHQLLMRNRADALPNGFANFQTILANERQQQMKLQAEFRSNRNGSDESPPPLGGDSQLTNSIVRSAARADINSPADKSDLKHKPRLMNQSEPTCAPRPLTPNPSTAQVGDWHAAANQDQLRRL